MSERSRPAAQRQDRQSRRYGFACANCRRKKARCNGGFPICDRCKTSKETCSFDKAPSVAYAVALENKLKQSEDLLERLRDANDAERPSILKDHFNLGSDASDHPASGDQRVSPDDSTTQSNSSPNDTLELTNEASVDEEGRICFYGKTSLYHIETQPFTWPNSSSTPPSSLTIPSINEPTSLGGSGSFSRELGSNASPMLRSTSTDVWASIMKSGISAELVEELLETYWCWPHHLHRVLCRRIFLRDFSAGGQYATRFLANVILSQAARYSDRLESPGFSDIFAANALQLLPEEIDNGSSIPTIQGLLIFSARECACGRTSQGWLYSGMAFRMMRDMGLHIPPEKLVSQFQPEELALRQQLFWSCYTWDKTMSLCLGRNPNIHDHIPLPSPDHLLDGEEAENEIWRPKFAARSISEGLVAQKARTNTRFVAYCELCIIIDGILDTLYTRPQNRQHEIHQYLKDTMGKLDRWAATLPGHLLIGSQSKAVSCPPLHILLLK
ncbi:fungal-specific transcription factor domain-containing protein [Lophiotrema nucula]|uniref:Fungal-specific transcription factor domain-containing protein n=1 Tax=Lophiotrema nucula TaxID=690887 RepID=A0A6A5YSM0_9PLEO|nr:fungal-specific transcription factor domain-containing protein [Lophiotrema nucula]